RRVAEVQDEQGDREGENPVAEGLRPRGVLRLPIVVSLHGSRVGDASGRFEGADATPSSGSVATVESPPVMPFSRSKSRNTTLVFPPVSKREVCAWPSHRGDSASPSSPRDRSRPRPTRFGSRNQIGRA